MARRREASTQHGNVPATNLQSAAAGRERAGGRGDYVRPVNGVRVVLLTLLGVTLVQLAVWAPLLLLWRKRSRAFLEDFRARAASTGERFVAGPERAVYRGGSSPYSAIKGNGTMILTDRRLVFRKLTGGMVEVPASRITGTRRAKGFRGSRVGGATHLVVATTDPAEVAFFVKDLAAWEQAVASVRP